MRARLLAAAPCHPQLASPRPALRRANPQVSWDAAPPRLWVPTTEPIEFRIEARGYGSNTTFHKAPFDGEQRVEQVSHQ